MFKRKFWGRHILSLLSSLSPSLIKQQKYTWHQMKYRPTSFQKSQLVKALETSKVCPAPFRTLGCLTFLHLVLDSTFDHIAPWDNFKLFLFTARHYLGCALEQPGSCMVNHTDTKGISANVIAEVISRNILLGTSQDGLWVLNRKSE